jgi:tyrosinase
LQKPEINITLPEGPKTIPNPLFCYTFHPLPDWTFDSTWQGSASTLRQPEMRSINYTDYIVELRTVHDNATNTTTQYNETIPVTRTRLVRDPSATSRNEVVAKNLDGNRENIQLRVYTLLAFEKDYLRMSCEVQGPGNIENIHGTIHNTVGGSAHMWNLRYSAFDPIFWLHHSNVDRLFAIWEMLNKNYSVPSWSNKARTFTMPSGVPTDGDTRKSLHLTPFPHHSQQ